MSNYTININPTECVRCKTPDSAEGYYQVRPLGRVMGKKSPWPTVKIGICRQHKAHGGSKIFWYAKA